MVHLCRNSAIEDFVAGIAPTVTEQVGALSDQEPRGVLSVTETLDGSRDEGAYPEGLQPMWRDAYAGWFPAKPWRTRPGPELLRAEWHDNGTADGELWLPVEPDPR